MSFQLQLVEHKRKNGSDQSKLSLYHCPIACSHIIHNALEEIGESYSEAVLALSRGEQLSPEYRAINPKAKVPTLVDAGQIITEVPAILYHLASTRPEAKLLPLDSNGRPELKCLSDMIWLSHQHLYMNQIVFPMNTAPGDQEGVTQTATKKLSDAAVLMCEQYAKGTWYYGENWSIVDVYINWIFGLASQRDFPTDTFPALVELSAKVKARDSYKRVREVELAAAARANLTSPPGLKL